MNLLEARPESSKSGVLKGALHSVACLGIELFPSRQEAEARIEHWQRLGQRNVWLHEVCGLTVSDLRNGFALETAFKPNASGVIYALVKVS